MLCSLVWCFENSAKTPYLHTIKKPQIRRADYRMQLGRDFNAWPHSSSNLHVNHRLMNNYLCNRSLQAFLPVVAVQKCRKQAIPTAIPTHCVCLGVPLDVVFFSICFKILNFSVVPALDRTQLNNPVYRLIW